MTKPGIKDIARLSGVSPATVSRVLRNPGLVSEDTRTRVMAAIDKAGYKPNRFGASLRTQKSGNIMVVIPDITNQVNAGIIRAIESEAQKAGYCILLGDTQGKPEREQHYADMVNSGQADGILLFTANLPFSLDHSRPLLGQLPPLVNANEANEYDEIYKVVIDNRAGAQAAMEHLLELGHTRIAAVLGPLETPTSRERLAGYRQALEHANIEIDEELIIPGDYGTESGRLAMEKLLKLRHRPTAVFCFSDDMAIGAVSVLHQYGFAIPGDMSVMGFDDIRYATLLSPALTTVHQPLEEIGKASMQLLLQQLKGEEPEQRYIVQPFSLVIRQSTGPVPR